MSLSILDLFNLNSDILDVINVYLPLDSHMSLLNVSRLFRSKYFLEYSKLCKLNKDLKNSLIEGTISHNNVDFYQYILQTIKAESEREHVYFAAFYGSLELLEYLIIKIKYVFDVKLCSMAAKGGQLKVLKWARQQNPPCPWDEWTCAYGAKDGQSEVLKWARQQNPPCPWDEWTCAYGAKYGQLEALKWARQNGCPWSWDTCFNAAEEGHLEILKWARQQNPPCPWDEWTCAYAALGENYKVVKWLYKNGCPWDKKTCEYAAENGNLKVLQWVRQQDPPCPWDKWTCVAAAKNKHTGILKWALQNGCPSDEL